MPDERTYGFAHDDAQALAQSIETKQTPYQETKPRGQQVRRQAILLADLAAAVNTLRDPSAALAVFLNRNADGDLVRSGNTETIVNRFSQISIDAGTYIKVECIDGEWQPYAADCPGGSLSESI